MAWDDVEMINKIKKIIGLVSEKKPQREGSFDEMTVDMSESNDVRSMHIGSPTIQSSMRISDPYHLELGYTQIMALAAIFLDKPKDLLFQVHKREDIFFPFRSEIKKHFGEN